MARENEGLTAENKELRAKNERLRAENERLKVKNEQYNSAISQHQSEKRAIQDSSAVDVPVSVEKTKFKLGASTANGNGVENDDDQAINHLRVLLGSVLEAAVGGEVWACIEGLGRAVGLVGGWNHFEAAEVKRESGGVVE